jgi:hypothetical protein
LLLLFLESLLLLDSALFHGLLQLQSFRLNLLELPFEVLLIIQVLSHICEFQKHLIDLAVFFAQLLLEFTNLRVLLTDQLVFFMVNQIPIFVFLDYQFLELVVFKLVVFNKLQ